jgi:tetratricopeptide (TPR) repeat protein
LIAATLLAGSALAAQPALAARPSLIDNPALAYVEARAASMSGQHARAAELFAQLSQSTPDVTIARKALSESISAGDTKLGLRLARELKPGDLTIDARLLLIADELKRGRNDRAFQWLVGPGEEDRLDFLEPFLRAWAHADRGDLAKALETVDRVSPASLLGNLRIEQRALILLKFGKTVEAEPFARRAIGMAGGRESRLRLALADGFLKAGDKQRALAMVEGLGADAGRARERILAGQPSGQAIDTSAKAFSELLLGLAVDLSRMNDRALPVGLVQVARYASPQNSGAAVLLGVLLAGQDRPEEALAAYRSVPLTDPQSAQARDYEARLLTQEKRFGEALTLAQGAVNAPGAAASDFARLGDVLDSMKRYDEAAAAYGRAVELARAQGLKSDLWPLYLLQASALEEANRWPQAKQALQAGLAIAPEQPLILNFLGYAKLEHGEDLDSAEVMIRKASELAPDDASITDSLGWALFKRGRVDEAIQTLQRAAAKDPQQAEIHEHLGDALFKAGRRFEARFAWSAALITAEDDIAKRVKAKLDAGLSTANAAP